MRYGLVWVVFIYLGTLVGLHVCGLFPRPGADNLARWIGQPSVQVSGRIVDFPVTRWEQTRFVLEGDQGRVGVTLAFPRMDMSPGDSLTLRGWLSRPAEATQKNAFNARHYWASQDVYALLKVWNPDSVLAYTPVPRQSLAFWIWEFRKRFRAFWDQSLPSDEAALMIGLTIGGKGVLPPDLKERCIRAGVYHLVVVSGQNLAMLLVAALWLVRGAGVPRRFLLYVTAVPIFLYTQLSGSDPPILRAGLMAIYALTASALRRDVPRLYPLVFSAGFLILLTPEALFGASFQLSFAATAGLMLFLPRLESGWRPPSRVLRWAWSAMLACVVVHLTVGPLLAFYFQRVSISGLAAPFVVYPLAALAMVMGLGVGFVGSVQPTLVPAFMIQGLDGVMRLLVAIIEWLARWECAVISTPAVTVPILLGWTIGLFGILWAIHRRQNHADPKLTIPQRRHRL